MASTRAAARAAIAAWFAPPNVAGLNTIYRAEPRVIPTNAYFAGTVPGTRTGAVGVIHILSKHEQREAMGGAHGGIKRVDYECALELVVYSSQRTAEQAADDFDALTDAVESRLRADRTLGSADVWQAGEKDIDIEYFQPHLTAQWIKNFAAVKFDLTQMLMNT